MDAKATTDGHTGVRLPAGLKDLLEALGETARFVGRFFKQVFLPPYELGEVVRQCYLIGNGSLLLVGLTAFIMGLVLALQSLPTLEDFGAESMAPSMVSISVVREIGPVITAIICAGKVGSSIGAELAGMRVTEQIDAMEVSAVNPFKYLVVSRVLACTLMLPLLVVYADAISLVGGLVGVNIYGETSWVLYKSHVFASVEFYDLVPALIKSVFFGFFIGIASCVAGYNATNGTEGVGQAANSAVVASILWVFILDMLAVQITNVAYELYFAPSITL